MRRHSPHSISLRGLEVVRGDGAGTVRVGLFVYLGSGGTR